LKPDVRPTEKGINMPLIRITHAAGKSPAYRQAIADGVHQALVGSLNVPADDRFQIVTEQPADGLIFDRDYLGIRRSADIVFIQVFLRRSRSSAMKQEFYRQVAAHLTAAPGLSANDIFITLSENDLADWSFGQGRAQYIDQPPAHLTAPDGATQIGSTQIGSAEMAAADSGPVTGRHLLSAAGSLLVAGFIAIALLALVHIVAPDRLDAALAKALPGTDPVTLAGFTA
jgi:phenylpyruvate tautomerase PptA (4-oxalocrotonate tautomerase family)